MYVASSQDTCTWGLQQWLYPLMFNGANVGPWMAHQCCFLLVDHSRPASHANIGPLVTANVSPPVAAINVGATDGPRAGLCFSADVCRVQHWPTGCPSVEFVAGGPS